MPSRDGKEELTIASEGKQVLRCAVGRGVHVQNAEMVIQYAGRA